MHSLKQRTTRILFLLLFNRSKIKYDFNDEYFYHISRRFILDSIIYNYIECLFGSILFFILKKLNINIRYKISRRFKLRSYVKGQDHRHRYILSYALYIDEKEIKQKCCKNLINTKIVFLGHHVKTIHTNAFRNCISLKRIYIPKTLDLIESDAFLNCISLEKVIFY